MAHTGIFATKAECDAKAGENVDATGWTEANINAWCLQAESFINCACHYNFSDKYSTLNADVKYILTEIASNIVAIYGIQYNMGRYTTRTEAEDMINVLRDAAMRSLSILREQRTKDFINGA
jgi:hypothetical protein